MDDRKQSDGGFPEPATHRMWIFKCVDCGQLQQVPSFLAEGRDPYPGCPSCKGEVRKVTPDIPSLGRLSSIGSRVRISLVLSCLEPIAYLLDEIDMQATDGKPRTRIVLDFVEATLRGHGQADLQAVSAAVRDLVMYTQVAQQQVPQAVGHALLSLTLPLIHDCELSAASTYDVLFYCLVAGELSKEHSQGMYSRLRQLESTTDTPADSSECNLFISYRHNDTGLFVGRVVDHLENRYGKGAVSIDIESIPGGVDFRRHIEQTIHDCDILIAVVGRGWMPPSPWVVMEISIALSRKIPVVPLLVENAEMPTQSDLPGPIQEFAYHNAIRVHAGKSFRTDIEHVTEAVDELLLRRRDGSRN